ncbi:MAG TPA: hypothetical protein VF288_14595 [Mycobacteriales bacterium]
MTAGADPARSAIEVARAAWGAALLLAPRAVLARVHHVQQDTAAVRVARLLGARQLAQAALSGVAPSRTALVLGMGVDAIHALTGVGFAAVDRRRARGALTDAAISVLWVAAGQRAQSRQRPDSAA